MKFLKNLGFLAMGMLFLVSCSDDDDNFNDGRDGSAMMSIKMVDAPGDYDAVYVDVEDVKIKYSGDEAEISFDSINAGIYDLLKLTAGNSVTLVNNDSIPDGRISQIRLILGEDNSVVIDGDTIPLATPSAQQSGLKIQVNEDLEAGATYNFTLDFDANQSIVEKGNGEYLLKPVIRASLEAETGSISGKVLPVGTATVITATSADSTVVVTTQTDEKGDYVLTGLPEGTYELTFEADSSLGLDPIIISGVQVTAGVATKVDDVVFEL